MRPWLIGATPSPSTSSTFLVTVTVTASFGLSWVIDFGICRFWSKVMVDVDEENDFNKKTRMMVIMSIIGVMLRSLMTSGSDSLRAYERIAFLPCNRLTSLPIGIRESPPQRRRQGTRSSRLLPVAWHRAWQ